MTPTEEEVAAVAPCRVQLSRAKGWRMPENTVSVARPTKWGNPFTAEDCGSRATAAQLFRWLLRKPQSWIMRRTINPGAALVMIVTREKMKRELHELRGKNLACWCKLTEPCHADVLLELANAPSGQAVAAYIARGTETGNG